MLHPGLAGSRTPPWDHFQRDLHAQLDRWPFRGQERCDFVVFQCDTRPRGQLSDADAGLNGAALLWSNFLRAQAPRGGVYLFLDIGAGPFRDPPMYWACPVLLSFVRLASPNADVHYSDSDAFVFPDLLEERCARIQPPLPDTDHFLLFTDPNGPVNLGILILRQGQAKRAQRSSRPLPTGEWNRAHASWERTHIPVAPPPSTAAWLHPFCSVGASPWARLQTQLQAN